MEHPRHIVVVGALVTNAAGKLLLIRHRQRGWEIPQGRVEEGEGLIEALLREVLEETGVKVTPGPLAAIFSKLTPPSALIFAFLARWRSGELTPSPESPEVAWCSPGEAVERVTHPVNRARLSILLGYQGALRYSSYRTAPFRIVNEASLVFPEPEGNPLADLNCLL